MNFWKWNYKFIFTSFTVESNSEITTTTTTTTRIKNVGTFLGQVKLYIYYIYMSKVTVYKKKLMSNKYIYKLLNKLCNQVLYQYFIQRI